MTRTLLTHARIQTMNPAQPVAQALVIEDARILALGDHPAMAALAGSGAKVIDAQGHLVLPGFQDAHIHLLNGGTDLVETAPLYDCTTTAEISAAMAAHAARHDGPMLWGAGWQCGFFGDENLTHAVLDPVTPDRPCLIYDGNFHNACLNARAIRMIGLTDDTPDPPNGHFVRDAAGRATGMLHEDAIYWALDRLPKTTEATFRAGLRAGQAHANRHGITGVLDPFIQSHHVGIYAHAAATDALTLRVAGAMSVTAADTVDSALSRLTALRDAHRGDGFHLHSAKFFLDGGLENRTAALIDDYADAPGGNAPLMFAPDQIAALFTALDAARFQIHVHCIGDRATRAALDGFAAARAANGPWPALHQIAHCQLVHPDDRPRFAALGVMANLQPLWACHDPVIPDDTMAMIGPARAAWTYPFRSLIDAGAPWCINSDWAVTTLNPFEIIGTAITREPPRHRGRAAPFFPAERITRAEAIQGYTTQAAAACWRSHHTGTLRPGFSADLIVLDRDILTCDPYAIAETQVLLTLFQGRAVHRAAPFT
ncbi:amidohydrolase [Paragemmobacter ruber]|uniref:Amidohydrolase family protein n=1 Tax=Paragemmobacter ruber TaxID=1985673 RepID=A0ABW9YBM2_9RHOB|nr:amidohydrolase [Rhodobacter ruber]NBE09551.1 amidohydrolase family protein [Rhodobacter ruber]